MQIDNTFWIIKPLLIPHFHKFAEFCQITKRSDLESWGGLGGSLDLDLSNFGLNGDGGFLNVIYLRLFSCKGTITIHRTSSLILGAKSITDVKLLTHAFDKLIENYINCLNSS